MLFLHVLLFFFFFFFNDTATTEIYTLSLHDALPISSGRRLLRLWRRQRERSPWRSSRSSKRDRKSTRLNSSHSQISYAVFCLKKKKNTHPHHLRNTKSTNIIGIITKHYSRNSINFNT